MDEKLLKFQKLFKQKGFIQRFSIGREMEKLFDSLDEDEIEYLNQMNTTFIRVSTPGSKTVLNDLNTKEYLTLITVDPDNLGILPDEYVAIILHEIGHILNNEGNYEGIDAEYVADSFVNKKGYGKWIISCLKKGVENKWIGFEKNVCDLRIKNLLESPK